MTPSYKTLVEHLAHKFMEQKEGLQAEINAYSLDEFLAFCDSYLRRIRPVALAHGHDANYRIQLADDEHTLVLLAPELPGAGTGDMQPGVSVPIGPRPDGDNRIDPYRSPR